MATLGGGGGVVQLTQPQQRRVQWLRLRGGGLGREGRKALKRCLLSVRKLAALAEYSRKRAAASMAKRMNSPPRPRLRCHRGRACAAAALLPSCDLNAAAYVLHLHDIVRHSRGARRCHAAVYRRLLLPTDALWLNGLMAKGT